MGRKGREKFNVGSATRRRTVLQIEPVSRRKENEGSQPNTRKREINPTSISGIGLLGQYADNSDDEGQRDSSDEENVNEEDQTKPHDEVDSKLTDFFKEIEAISTEDPKSAENNETTDDASNVDETATEEQPDASAFDQNMQGYVLPSPWQQVCDPVTNYIYYWNTLTNEVSWELPEIVGPIQPLLPVEEQLPQDTLSQLDVDGDSENIPGSLTGDQSTLRSENIATNTNDDTKLDDDERAVTTSGTADNRNELEESITPIQREAAMPPETESRASDEATSEISCPLPDKLNDSTLNQSEKGLDEGMSTSSETCHTSQLESSSPSRKRERPEVIDMFESEAREDNLDQNESEKQQSILEYWTEERMKSAVPEEMPEYSPSAENGHVSTNTSPDYGQSDDNVSINDEKVDVKDQETFEPTERSEKEDDNSVGDDDLEVPAKKAKYESESDQESEGEFAEKLLEEFLEGKSTDIASSGDDMEVESDNDQPENEVSTPLLPPEAFQHNRADRLKEDGGNSPADITRSRVEVDRKTEEENEKLTTEIHDLCQLLSNKLEFLNINKDGLNKLLIVLIQMETRIKDWREGGLNSAYIVKKLREAAEELNKYEQSAVPKGWSCHWESTYKRYFYTNKKTGESKWEYPAEVSTTSDVSSVEAKKLYSVADVAGSWDTSVVTEATSANPNVLTSSLEQSHLYPSHITNMTAYPVVAATSSNIPTNVTQDISSLRQFNETTYNTLTSSLDTDANTATVYPVIQPSTASTDVTKDPYRFDDDSPLASENNREHGNTPPSPGLSPPPPPPAEVQTVPPPPPPQDDVVDMIIPAPPPPSSPENVKCNEVERVDTSTEKSGVVQFQRPLVDYSDLEGGTNQYKTKVQSGGSRSSPVPMQANTKPRKKKSKSSSVPIRTSKVKKMSSLVQKWQAIKKQEEENLSDDESDEEDYAAKTEAQIEQWRQEQITSGLAADNPNFQEITGDWRERVRKAKLRTAAKTDQ